MKRHDNVIFASTETRGLILGLVGVLIFSVTMTASRAAAPVLGGAFVGVARSAIAGCVALVWLVHTHAPIPRREHRRGLAVVALGGVFGFPLFASIGMAQVSAVHGMVMTAFIPAMTAAMAVLRAAERPSARWWAWTLGGASVVTAWAWGQGGGGFTGADGLLLLAMGAAALAYAEGARLTPALGGLRVMAWALVLGLPITLPAALASWPGAVGGVMAWGGLAWLGLMSSFVGFGFWYRGLAEGGIARVGQVQTLQPLLGLGWAALLLGERIDGTTIFAALGVVVCVAGGVRERTRDGRVVPQPDSRAA